MLLTLPACVKYDDPATGGDTEATGTTTGTTGTTAAATTAASTAEPTTGGGGGGECDLWQQDCAGGMKCAPYDSMQIGVVDATRCVEVADPAGEAGDPCRLEGGVVGLDDCAPGLLCWLLDGEGNGTCTPLCKGSPEEPTCDDGLVCDISNGGLLPLCLTSCHPLAKDCPQGQICLLSMAETFVCDSDASGEEGQIGDPCEYINVCDPGLLCLASTHTPGCSAPGCCTSYCDLSDPNAQCPYAQQECLPYFPNNMAPPGYENVGFCGIKD
ncbi:MAG TPA: ribulose phosphate epimerase [Nannocystis sp.]